MGTHTFVPIVKITKRDDSSWELLIDWDCPFVSSRYEDGSVSFDETAESLEAQEALQAWASRQPSHRIIGAVHNTLVDNAGKPLVKCGDGRYRTEQEIRRYISEEVYDKGAH